MTKEKIKDVEKPKIPDKIQEQYRPQKEGRSTFDKILEQNRLLQESPRQTQMTAQKTEHQETRVARHQEQGERGSDRQSDEKEQERGKQKAKEERKSGVEVEQRVVGRGAKRDSSGSGSGRHGGDRGFGRPMQRKAEMDIKKASLTRAAQVAQEGSEFAARLKARMQTAHLSREFVQNIVNQVVKFVRSGINKDGDHEVRLDLHERIFKGLRLRIALKHGKVSVHFNTSNAEVRELFTGSSGNIQKELEAKGISVGEIKVT